MKQMFCFSPRLLVALILALTFFALPLGKAAFASSKPAQITRSSTGATSNLRLVRVSSTDQKAVNPNITYGCNGLSCNGVDPVASHCNQGTRHTDTWNLTGVNNYVFATLANIYVYECNANWGEITSINSGVKGFDGFAIDVFTTDSAGKNACTQFPSYNNVSWFDPGTPETSCYQQHSTFYYGTALPAWSNMLDGTNAVKVCVYMNTGNWSCLAQ